MGMKGSNEPFGGGAHVSIGEHSGTSANSKRNDWYVNAIKDLRRESRLPVSLVEIRAADQRAVAAIDGLNLRVSEWPTNPVPLVDDVFGEKPANGLLD